MEQIVNSRNIIIYFILINIIAFFSMFLDKRKAKKHKWRISENTLMGLALLGGEIGALIGMYKFRHKTQKPKFVIGIPMFIVMKILLVIIYFI